MLGERLAELVLVMNMGSGGRRIWLQILAPPLDLGQVTQAPSVPHFSPVTVQAGIPPLQGGAVGSMAMYTPTPQGPQHAQHTPSGNGLSGGLGWSGKQQSWLGLV